MDGTDGWYLGGVRYRAPYGANDNKRQGVKKDIFPKTEISTRSECYLPFDNNMPVLAHYLDEKEYC